MCAARHDSHERAEILDAQLTDVRAIDGHRSRGDIEEAWEQGRKRRLAPPVLGVDQTHLAQWQLLAGIDGIELP